ncbi:hypothetical protein BOW53_05760 [Solemya pervernicosa gill symbiont]|uniref:DUF3549 domain-containing protein n=2 Tax=Gammaproteobacteria incertae sedis TaxID=118884 RepID=A0A1T2L7V4_9GAMM|nr:DUF3549 family protein [Candidatus Reidiella endopervernicosa]OOZ41026.1 hypothetical protein BOW53_05760 [Solemya pervernicosa gill symbiont]QKQ25088.1 DUF3549 family protein [Candidatus Reidiella endopervernicosa]
MAEAAVTIGGLLESGRYDYQAFDIGRGVHAIERIQFEQFEACIAPYLYPLKQHAWLAILGWNPDNREEHFVWFLKFPLDEQSKLNQAARDDFLSQLVEAFGTAHASDEVGSALSESPYGIKPREETMALFHAKALKQLDQPPSRFFEHAHSYFSGEAGFDQWAFVGLQGIADLASRLDEGDNSTLLAKALPHLPNQPFSAVVIAIESEAPGESIAAAIEARADAELAGDEIDIALLVASVRGLSTSPDSDRRRALLRRLLNSSQGTDIELLAAIAGRCWNDLKEPTLAVSYLDALAENSAGEAGFNAIMSDLLYIPGLREPLLQRLRDPERSEKLAAAFGKLFGA